MISFFQGPFTTDLRKPLSKKWGFLWLFYLNTGKYWTTKNHSVFLTNITNLLNPLCKRIMYICLLYSSFLFTNTFIGEIPFRFCDIFYEYFEINFKNYFVIWFSLIGSRTNTSEENCPPTLTLTLTLTQTLTLTGGQFFSRAIVWVPLDFIAI